MIKIAVRDASQIKAVKTRVESAGWLNKSKKIEKVGDVSYVFTTISSGSEFHLDDLQHQFQISIESYVETPRPSDRSTEDTSLAAVVRRFYTTNSLSYNFALDDYIPKRWTIYHPLVLFNCNTFDSDLWCKELTSNIDANAFFSYILASLFPKCTHVAVNKPIHKQSIMRIPANILPLHGDFGPGISQQRLSAPTQMDFQSAFWCTVNQNGVLQTWCPTYTMFSRGNIKEKKRLLDTFTGLSDTYVLDLYAGIGYFSLSYLKNKAKVLCWELNPWSTEALQRNCQINGFSYKFYEPNQTPIYDASTQAYIFNDNNETAIESVNALLNGAPSIPISHINLGLLPSSKQSWPTAKHFATVSSLKTVIHVHENVHVDEFESFATELTSYFPGFTVQSINKIKTFAPDVWHVVFDIQKE